MLRRLREAYPRIEGRAAPYYGLSSALGVTFPLLVGIFLGHPGAASLVALGAFLVAVTAPEGPYGARARALFTTVAVVTSGAIVGGLLSGHIWLTVLVLPFVVALGVAVPWVGTTAGLALLLVAIRPASSGGFTPGILELVGGVWVSLLMLAPWPAWRLRPLRAALAEAAQAVAATLDAVGQNIGGLAADPLAVIEITEPELAEVVGRPDWERRRLKAAEALNAARATYALYRAPGARELTRPERFIDTLSRILHETVALRAMVEAARRRPTEGDWELEARTAVAALAARLRLLANAVSTTQELPLGGGESRAVHRLHRTSEHIRRAGLAGEDDIVAAALVGQVRHTIDRISRTVESARRVVAADVRLGLALPRWTGHGAALAGQLREARDRLVIAIRTRSPTFRQATRLGLAVAAALAIAAGIGFPYGHWLVATVLLSLRASYGETVTDLGQRVGGTAIGSSIAAVLLAVASGQRMAAVLVFLFALIGFTIRPVNLAIWILFGTPLVLMLLDFTMESDWTVASVRIGLTLGGGLLALLAARLLWPSGDRVTLPGQLARLLASHARLVREATAMVDEPATRLPRDRLNEAENATEEIARIRRRLGHEPVPDTELIARLRTAIDAARRVRDHTISVAQLSREELLDAGPVPAILDHITDHLEEIADVVARTANPQERRGARAGEAGISRSREEFARELADDLTDLDDHLSALVRKRRGELAAGVRLEESSPLRQAILQAAGIRLTLRTIRADADELSRATLDAVSPPAQPG